MSALDAHLARQTTAARLQAVEDLVAQLGEAEAVARFAASLVAWMRAGEVEVVLCVPERLGHRVEREIRRSLPDTTLRLARLERAGWAVLTASREAQPVTRSP